MKQSVLKDCTLTAAFAALLISIPSCTKQSDGIETEPELEVVSHASFSMAVGDESNGTRASIDGSMFNWQVGDRIVMASNSQINGTLVCSNVDKNGRATFGGDINNFTPACVNLFFLGNKEPFGMNPVFDFSMQEGTAHCASGYVFLKMTGLVLSGAGGTYFPAEPVRFEGMTTLLTLKLDPEGSPGTNKGVRPVSVGINGLMNCCGIDLSTGDLTPMFMKMPDGNEDNTISTVSPGNYRDYSNNYMMAVIPQNAENITMSVTYLNPDGTYEYTMWSGINWDLSSKAGKSVYTNWEGGKAPVIVEPNFKSGYSGLSVDSDEDVDYNTPKNGYEGVSVDGQVDNPSGEKNGYGGTDVE